MKSRRAFFLIFLIVSGFTLTGSEVAAKDPVLLWAAKGNLVSLAKILIDKGVDVNERDILGNTPLHAAVRFPEMVNLLLDAGAEVNSRNALGETPLQLAVPYHDVVAILLSRGADTRIRNSFGRTALDYCMDQGVGKYNQSVMKLLLSGE